MTDVTVIDLIQYASENKPIEFASALDNILGQKALEAIEAKKLEIAASMFNGPQSKEDDSTDESEEEYIERALDDMELDKEEDSGETDD
jgi:hypothetical protein